MKKYKKNDGFTLIELLVVIAIIGILAGISVPKVSKVRDKANLSVVKADLRSIQTAIEIYAMDNSDYPTKENFSNIDFDDTSSFTYDVNETNYLVMYNDTIETFYYYIKSSENGIQSASSVPSL